VKKKSKSYKSADEFFDSIMIDPEIRLRYHEERTKSQIAAVIKAARKRADLTQKQLAEKIETSQSVIARLESGADSRTPSLALLSKIAVACNAVFEFGFAG
jgi:ribosome-binding protein aMBF1 (putative translation factor)